MEAYFTLKVLTSKTKRLVSQTDLQSFGEKINESYEAASIDNLSTSRWDNIENDLTDFSTRYPHLIFIVEMTGLDTHAGVADIVAHGGESEYLDYVRESSKILN